MKEKFYLKVKLKRRYKTKVKRWKISLIINWGCWMKWFEIEWFYIHYSYLLSYFHILTDCIHFKICIHHNQQTISNIELLFLLFVFKADQSSTTLFSILRWYTKLWQFNLCQSVDSYPYLFKSWIIGTFYEKAAIYGLLIYSRKGDSLFYFIIN